MKLIKQNDVSHKKVTFKVHSLPLLITIGGWGKTPKYVKDNYRLPLVYVPNLFFYICNGGWGGGLAMGHPVFYVFVKLLNQFTRGLLQNVRNHLEKGCKFQQ